ncbi:MAG: HPr family phosphocarrier protein [Lachnospiraceae bacterium]|nr:HPr family phosphocarrier protein [Lachnospiraceae bacterium]MBR4058317.1 HPr family phosphocarrier protein [Lachnospiraceae bacterium]
MIRKTVKIQLDAGLDFRPVAMLVQIANQYDSDIYLQDEKHKFNAKSIMGVMTLCTADCEEIEVVAEGEDAEKAVDHIEKYLRNEGN